MLPSPETLNERFSLLSQRLRLEIKKRLRTWRRDDPDVRIEMEIDRDCFDLLKSCGKVVDKRGKDVVIVKDVRKLEPVLGKNWNFRVINANLDFDYVAEDTKASVCFWLVERDPIQEYNLIGGLKFYESRLEQEPLLVFTFVVKSGNKNKFYELGLDK